MDLTWNFEPLKDAEPLKDVVNGIVRTNKSIARFWSGAWGWAPPETANLLSGSRLDWQVSLSRTLALWIPPQRSLADSDAEGRLILAWANLGALVEGTLKWFACVYYDDYQKDQDAICDKKTGTLLDPDGLKFDRLRTFFQKSVWTSNDDYDPWILQIQQRRNAVYAFKDRDIGTFNDFDTAIRRYSAFLEALNGRVPYPEESIRG